MKYRLSPTKLFLKQLLDFNESEHSKIKAKLLLAKQNPYRYKSVHSKEFSKVFRIRITIESKEMRIVYTLVRDKIIIVCIIDRDKGYKDLERYLSSAKNDMHRPYFS